MLLALLVGAFGAASAALPWFNGMNVPWNNFGADVGGTYDAAWFDTFFTMCNNNGINSARYWLHANGYKTPVFNADGSVQGLTASFLSDLTKLADQSKAKKIVLQIALWSFDMCKNSGSCCPPRTSLITDATHSQSYIDKALIPMLNVLKNYDHVIIEVANEPEWCIRGPGNTDQQADLSQWQRFTAMIAAAVHSHSKLKVTTGASALKWNSDAVPPAEANYWSDRALRAAYNNNPNATLDFYNVHYYDWMYNPDWGYDPCRKNASFWKLDKPTVVAELPPTSAHYTTPQMMSGAFDNGFIGDMFWAYNDHSFNYAAALPALKAFAQQHAAVSNYDAIVAWLKSL
jgi:hypothetical protein